MRLYYHPLSSNSRRAILVARHLGLALDMMVVDLTTGEQKADDYLQINPTGRVPTLVDGDFQLWESHAIIQYLADRTPGQDIYPPDVEARADVNRWLFWSACHFAPAAALLIRERVSKKVVAGAGAPDPQQIARGEAEFPVAAAVLDAHLAGRRWVTQDRLTIADFALAAPLMHRRAAQLPVERFENLDAWFSRVQALDAWAKTAG